MTIQLLIWNCHVVRSRINVSALNPKISPIKSLPSYKISLFSENLSLITKKVSHIKYLFPSFNLSSPIKSLFL